METRHDRTGGRSLLRSATDDGYLSRAWNNVLTIALAVPLAVYVVAVSSSSVSDRVAFMGMALIGAVY